MDSKEVKQTVKWDNKKLREFWDFEYKVRNSQFFSGVNIKPLTKNIRKFIGRKQQKILDLGCGNGDLVFSLARYYPSVSGADIESSRLEELKSLSNSFPKVQFFSNTELENLNTSFDIITSIEIIEHLNDIEMDAHIGQIRKLLKPEGIVFITIPNSENLERSFVRCPDCQAVFHKVQHMQSWSAKRITSYLHERGFEITNIRTTHFGLEVNFDFWSSFLVWGLKLLKRKMPNLIIAARLKSY